MNNFELRLIKDTILKLCEKYNFTSFSAVALGMNFTQEQTEQIELLINDCARRDIEVSKADFKREIEVILNRNYIDYEPINRILEGFKADFQIATDSKIYKFIDKLLQMD